MKCRLVNSVLHRRYGSWIETPARRRGDGKTDSIFWPDGKGHFGWSENSDSDIGPSAVPASFWSICAFVIFVYLNLCIGSFIDSSPQKNINVCSEKNGNLSVDLTTELN